MLSPLINRQSELLSELCLLVTRGEGLQMTTTYKGIPLTQRMTGITFDENCIRFNPLHHVSCDKLGQRIFIHHRSLPSAIETKISGIDLTNGAISVTNFGYIDHPFQTRRKDRVQPGHPIRVTLAVSYALTSACLVDISEDGLGALYYAAHESEPVIKPDLGVRISLRLPNVFLPLVLIGEINRSLQIGHSSMMSVGIQLNLTEKQSSQLRSYIRTRQSEILDELSDGMQMILEPVQTKDLYF